MIKRLFIAIILLCFVAGSVIGQQQTKGTIDRKALVRRHNLKISSAEEQGPTQVGNGEFAYNFDITGMQSLGDSKTIMSQWGWHSSPLPKGVRLKDYQMSFVETNGRKVPYDLEDPKHKELSEWLSKNPHKFNLGRIGLWVDVEGNKELKITDIEHPLQTLDLWTGVAVSTFSYKGFLVKVTTVADPIKDMVSFKIESPLLTQNKIGVFVDFPYVNQSHENNVSDYSKPASHLTTYTSTSIKSGTFDRKIDNVNYKVNVAGSFFKAKKLGNHRYHLVSKSGNKAEFSFNFSKGVKHPSAIAFDLVKKKSEAYWPSFWNSGGVIDLSKSKDPRWKELERRVVLSQYLMKINASGKYPPQETGLVSNSWYGRFHYEMIWWHLAHYTLWDRWALLNQAIHVYSDNLQKAQNRAKIQGYSGARFPKCTGPDGIEWPHPIHAFLVWQQPHPIFFAAMDYRAHPNQKTLEKWYPVTEGVGNFLATYAFKDTLTNQYILGTPISAVSENNNYYKDRNPAFELGYWRFGLRTANWLREKGGRPFNKNWDRVYKNLAEIPTQDNLYIQWENIGQMWTKFNWEHPGMLGIYGMLPGDGVDTTIMDRTFSKFKSVWQFDKMWGWDFPMAAMTAARLGRPKDAIDMLLNESHKNNFDKHGLVGGGNPYPYFPTNGGLLYAIAMMTAGWDGDKGRPEPGFPKDGSWIVRWEGLQKAM